MEDGQNFFSSDPICITRFSITRGTHMNAHLALKQNWL